MTTHKLTPAGLQVEQALERGYGIAAFNLYHTNIRDGVAMVDGDWPEWHRMIQARIGEGEVIGEREANEEADELGLEGEERGWFIARRVDEASEFEPSVIERTTRTASGEITGTELIPNPRLGVE